MLSETTIGLAEKFRQNWQTQYPYLSMDKTDPRSYQSNFQPKRINKITNGMGFINNQNTDPEDDSLTNLNWLQNLNLFSMSQAQPPLSPSPTRQMSSPSPQYPLSINPMNQLNRVMPQYFESSSLYAEVAMNLEFMNDEASVHFFKINNQLRPPFSDINLISMAIHSYNKLKVSFPEICQWIEETFPYYKSLPEDWRTGIKNHLTLSKCFQKVPRRREEAEKGGFWRFSNDFLNYLERNRMQRMPPNNYDNSTVDSKSCENAQPENQFVYKFGKIINRKRTINSIMTQDENRNSAFRIPKRKWFFAGMIDQNVPQLTNSNQSHVDVANNELRECKSAESLLLQYQDESRQSLCSMNPLNLPITSGSNDSMTNIGMTVSATADISQQQAHNNIFNHNIICSQMNSVAANSGSPCPEQVTEEEFLSGQAFNNNYITLNSNAEHMPSLLDTQNTFSNDFNINDLSITGIGLKPPEWWNQSFSASQISLSKFNCSFRSLTVANNHGETASPFCVGAEEDHHGIWSSDLSNLSELDMLFGLS